jgi:hypothetical protein
MPELPLPHLSMRGDPCQRGGSAQKQRQRRRVLSLALLTRPRGRRSSRRRAFPGGCCGGRRRCTPPPPPLPLILPALVARPTQETICHGRRVDHTLHLEYGPAPAVRTAVAASAANMQQLES